MAEAVTDVEVLFLVDGWLVGEGGWRWKRKKLDGMSCGNENGLGDEGLNDVPVRDRDAKELIVKASHLEGGSVAAQAGLHEDGHKLLVEVERGVVDMHGEEAWQLVAARVDMLGEAAPYLGLEVIAHGVANAARSTQGLGGGGVMPS